MKTLSQTVFVAIGETDMDHTKEIATAMAIRSIFCGVSELQLNVADLSERDREDLESARYAIEQILMKARYPILRRESTNLVAAE